jgi:hypothetical protein
MPCLPRRKSSRGCPPINSQQRTARPSHAAMVWYSLTRCHHLVSTAALAASHRGMVWCRRCRAHVSVGALLATMDVGRLSSRCRRACLCRRRGGAVARLIRTEVVL